MARTRDGACDMAACGAFPASGRGGRAAAAGPAATRAAAAHAATARADTAREAATAEYLGAAAAHAARAPVRRPAAGHDHPALARSSRWNGLLRLSADHGAALAAGNGRLRAVRLQHHRLDQLRAAG